MFSSFSLPFSWLRPGSSRSPRRLDLVPVKIHPVENSTEKRARTLKHLLKANHTNHSIIYHKLEFHNHAPHILGSAYLLGATSNQLMQVYEAESETLEPWVDSPGEISKDVWRDYLGKRNYQRAFIDFFEDQLVNFGYDWQKLLDHFLYEGDNPLINSLVSGLGHPLIHLGYAYELSSRTVGIEALGLASCFYSDLHKFLDDPAYTRPSSYTVDVPLEGLRKVFEDSRFDNLFDHPGGNNIETLLAKREDAIIDHWNAWQISTSPTIQFQKSQEAAVALVVATHKSRKYDFFLLHLLTTSHAVRILLPLIPEKFQIPLVRQWWLFTLLAYVAQLRPEIKMESINDFPLRDRTWKHVDHFALTSDYAHDAHYVKGLRAMKNAAETWGDTSEFYLKAAVKFATEFDDWGGFDELGN